MFGIIHHARNILRQAYFNSPRLVAVRSYRQVDEDGDVTSMRSTVSFLNDEMEGMGISGFSSLGFLLNNGLRVIGPCAVFPRSILQWNVRDVKDISEESLSLFTMLEPKIDILILGVGNYDEVPKLNKNVIKHFLAHKINFEVLSTEQAVSTFNILCDEKRYVAGAFIPPTNITSPDDEIFLNEKAGTPEYDMLRVMERMSKLKGEEFNKLPHESGDRKEEH